MKHTNPAKFRIRHVPNKNQRLTRANNCTQKYTEQQAEAAAATAIANY